MGVAATLPTHPCSVKIYKHSPTASDWRFALLTIRRTVPNTIRLEHRAFPHITRACEGVVFESAPLVKELIEKTQTKTGLRVTVDILDKVYETGRKAAKHLKSALNII